MFIYKIYETQRCIYTRKLHQNIWINKFLKNMKTFTSYYLQELCLDYEPLFYTVHTVKTVIMLALVVSVMNNVQIIA